MSQLPIQSAPCRVIWMKLVISFSLSPYFFIKFHPSNIPMQPWIFLSASYLASYWALDFSNFYSLIHITWVAVWFFTRLQLVITSMLVLIFSVQLCCSSNNLLDFLRTRPYGDDCHRLPAKFCSAVRNFSAFKHIRRLRLTISLRKSYVILTNDWPSLTKILKHMPGLSHCGLWSWQHIFKSHV